MVPEKNAAVIFPVKVIGFRKHTDKLEFARRAGGQVVHKICVDVSALRRSVSFYGAVNWNLQRELRASNNIVIPRK